MKVCIINTLYYPYSIGGAEKSVQFLTESLVDIGLNPFIISVGEQEGIHEVNGIKVYVISVENLYWPYQPKNFFRKHLNPLWLGIDIYNPLMGRKIGHILDLERPDIVHTNNLGSISVAAWSETNKRAIPLVHTIRDYYLMCARATMYHKDRECVTQCKICRVYAMARKHLSSLVDEVVGISNFILNRHVDAGFFPRAQLNIIHNSYRTEEKRRITCNGSLRLGYFGRILPSKGVELFIDAFLAWNHPNATLVIAGNGNAEYLAKLQLKCLNKKVDFIKWAKPADFFSSIDVLVVPSLWHEPLGRTVFEAYAHGVPVIGSRRGGIPEIVEEGRTGVLFEPYEPQALVEVFQHVISHQEDWLGQMRINCLEKAKQFLPERIAREYVKVYDTCKSKLNH